MTERACAVCGETIQAFCGVCGEKMPWLGHHSVLYCIGIVKKQLTASELRVGELRQRVETMTGYFPYTGQCLDCGVFVTTSLRICAKCEDKRKAEPTPPESQEEKT